MAKWGEGDPRWVVEHRQDGANVNGWHWEEKNKLTWSKQRLGELLTALTVDVAGSEAIITITQLKDLTGEAYITTRKGNKRFAVFDLKITLEWQGTAPPESDKPVQGEVVIEEFASTNDPDEYIMCVSCQQTDAVAASYKQALEKGKPALLKALEEYVAEIATF